MKHVLTIAILMSSLIGCAQKKRVVGGPCEGCEALLEYAGKLNAIDTLPGFMTAEPKLKITGVVYQNDGISPASEVILYIYQTNQEGVYPATGQGWGRRHGKHRGWVKTEKDGRYTFYTFKPAAYPNRRDPAHIHLTVKEPDTNPYYLDDYLFEGDPYLSKSAANELRKRGGSGLTKLESPVNGTYTIERDIILGLNIPEYDK